MTDVGSNELPREVVALQLGLGTRHHALSGVLRVENAPVAGMDLSFHAEARPEAISVLIRHVEAAVSTVLIPTGLVLKRNSGIVLRLLPAGRTRCPRERLSFGFRFRERVVVRMRNLVARTLIGRVVPAAVPIVSVSPSTA